MKNNVILRCVAKGYAGGTRRSRRIYVISLLKNHKFFLLILAAAFFLRTYGVVERYDFAHDGDLFSWIVKDIVVDGHPRLIGQLTTAPGIFIGPIFYYMLIPFFFLTNMDPVGAIIPIVMFGVLTVVSYYIVFTKLWNKTIGIIASFLYGILLVPVYFDSRVVPSTPTNLWLVWYFYAVMQLARGNYKIFPILGLLIGFIWHIHIALLPALAGAFFAILVSRTLPRMKEIMRFLILFAIPSIPLVLFELRHNFSQITSFINNFSVNHGGGSGTEKLNLVLIKFSDNISRLFFYPQGWSFNKFLLVVILLAVGFFLAKKGFIQIKEIFVWYAWIGVVILYYSVSSLVISEYYFANIEILFLAIAALLIYATLKTYPNSKWLIVGILLIVLAKNLHHLVTREFYKAGYVERKKVAQFIAEDSREKDFPCVSVSYVTDPGRNTGFRYLFWLNRLHVEQPKSGAPVYTIVLPAELVTDALAAKFGQIGVITPEKFRTEKEIDISCSGEDSNLTDPMFGFTK